MTVYITPQRGVVEGQALMMILFLVTEAYLALANPT
jgi:hypothetical protein